MRAIITLCGAIGVTTEADFTQPELRGAQGRIAFAHLLLERHRPIPRHRLVDVVWDGEPPSGWESATDALVSRARKALTDLGIDGRRAIRLRDGSYHVELPESVSTDVDTAARLLDQAREADAVGDVVAAAEAAAQAATLLAGDLLAGDANRWVEDRREECRSLRKHALLYVGTDAPDPGAACDALRAAITVDPFDERARVLLAERLLGAGRALDALTVIDDAERVSTDELGVPASATLLQIRQRAVEALGAIGGLPGIVCIGFATAPDAPTTDALGRAAELLQEQPGVTAIRNLGSGVAFVARAPADGFAAATVAASDGALVVAVHLGDAIVDEAGWSGPGVDSAREVALGQAPGVVVTDPLRALLPADIAEWDATGETALPASGHRVAVWRSHGPRALPQAALPAGVHLPSTLLVGRDDELAQLDAVVQRAERGVPAVAVIRGVAGIGKTRLLFTALHSAHDRGVSVMLGRCRASGQAPFQPVSEAIHGLVQDWSDHELQRVVGPNAAAVTWLVPSLAGRLTDTRPTLGTEPEARRFQAFEGVRQLLLAAAKERPIVLALDDLQWAHTATIDLLEHLVDHGTAHLAIVAAARDDETVVAWRDHSAAEEEVRLDGLPHDDVVTLLAQAHTAPLAQTHRLARRITDISEGNPFFITEIISGLADQLHRTGAGSEDAEARALELPASLRELLDARFAALNPRVLDTLAIAAVTGREVELEWLARIAGLTPDTTGEQLDAAVLAGVIEPSPHGPDWYGFAHRLFVERLVADLSPARRTRLHERIADALLANPTNDPEWLADLAGHLLDCGNRADLDRVEVWTRRAAAEAEADGAYATAADLYRRLLARRASFEIEDPLTDASLLLALGRAENRAGHVPGAVEALVAAAALGRSIPNHDVLADAAVELGWEWSLQFGAWVDPEVERVVIDALDALDGVRPRDWARVACVRFEHLYYADSTQASTLADRAYEFAVEHHDLPTAAQALRHRSHDHAAAPDQQPRIDMLERSTALLEQAGEPLRAQADRVHEGGARLTAADVDGFRRIAEQLSRFVEQVPAPRLRYFDLEWKAMLAANERRDRDAEALIEQASAIRNRWFPLSLDYPFFQHALLRHAQGRTDEIEPLLAIAAEAVPLPAVRASHALALASIGRHPEARVIVDALCDDDLEAVPRDFNYLVTLAFLADAAHTLDHHAAARLLLAHLLPHRDNIAVVGFGAATLGPVAGHVARLAMTTRDLTLASSMLDHALELSDRLGDDASAARLNNDQVSLRTLARTS